MTVNLKLLASVYVRGGDAVTRRDGSVVYLQRFRDTWRGLRAGSVQKAIREGHLEVAESIEARGRILVTDAGKAALLAHPDIVTRETVTRAVERAHRVDYQLYSRGNHPIRGWGAVAKGCTATCSCSWSTRENSGRAYAEEAFGYHFEDALEAALAEVGLELENRS